MAGFNWKDWIVPGLAYAAAPFTGGATLPYAYSATVGAASKTATNKSGGGGGGGGDDGDQPESPWLNQLGQSSQNLRQQGDQFTSQGQDALGPLLQRMQALLGENPGALMDATRQERGRVIDQYDTARRAISQFGPRGGGTTSALADSRFAQAESLADITSSAKNDAMGLAGGLGIQLSGLGLSAQQLASADIDTVIRAILAREGLNIEKRGQNMQAVGSAAETAGNLFGLWMTREGGPWGPKGASTGAST
jgi:hypothetical protein